MSKKVEAYSTIQFTFQKSILGDNCQNLCKSRYQRFWFCLSLLDSFTSYKMFFLGLQVSKQICFFLIKATLKSQIGKISKNYHFLNKSKLKNPNGHSDSIKSLQSFIFILFPEVLRLCAILAAFPFKIEYFDLFYVVCFLNRNKPLIFYVTLTVLIKQIKITSFDLTQLTTIVVYRGCLHMIFF